VSPSRVHRYNAGESETKVIYKIVPGALWRQAEATGVFVGAAVDLADGFIHFSAASQVEETAARHFARQDDLLLVAVEPASLGSALVWEPSRGGADFPHLYASLSVAEIAWVKPLPLRSDGIHNFAGLLS
jgi:uncharacterized protein (DUF952 family)